MSSRLAVIVNKDGNELSPSETFLHAHINQMPFETFSLVGNPGYRLVRKGSVGEGHYLASRSFFPLGIRWLSRQALGQTVGEQDTKALANWLKRSNIGMVLAEYGPTAVSVMEACDQAQVPLIAHFHGYDAYTDHVLDKFSADYRRLFEISSAVIGVSEHMCDQLVDLGAPRDRVFHNACGADVPHKQLRVERERGFRFAMIGRLVEKKAPFVSLLAFRRVVTGFPEATLEIVGDGPLRAACIQMIRALRLDDRVILHGAQPHSFVLEVLSRSDYFLQHSVKAPNGDMEGTPVGVLEAMGMGLPVISTRHGGICDIVAQDETGILVDEYDVDAMALAMNRLCDDPQIASRMGSSARESVINNWTATKSIERLAQIVQSASD